MADTNIGDLVARLRMDTRDFKSKSRSVQRDVRELATAFAAAAAATVALGVAFDRVVQRGGRVAGVQRAFTRVVGDSTAALSHLRQQTRGLIGDYDLMVQMNRAVALGAARNAHEFGQLAETAVTLGRALGVDAAFALESLSLGIGRQSRLILDNLGLIVSVEAANERYAAALGKTTKQLTDAETREAFRTAALEAARAKIEELGGVTLTAADSWQQFVTQIKNVRDQLALLVAESPAITSFLQRLGQGLAVFRQFPSLRGFALGFTAGAPTAAADEFVGPPLSGRGGPRRPGRAGGPTLRAGQLGNLRIRTSAARQQFLEEQEARRQAIREGVPQTVDVQPLTVPRTIAEQAGGVVGKIKTFGQSIGDLVPSVAGLLGPVGLASIGLQAFGISTQDIVAVIGKAIQFLIKILTIVPRLLAKIPFIGGFFKRMVRAIDSVADRFGNLGKETDRLGESARMTSDALANIPQGIKVALRRFQSITPETGRNLGGIATGTVVGGPGGGPGPFEDVTGRNVVINIQGVTDPREAARAAAEEFRRLILRGGAAQPALLGAEGFE